MLYRIREPHRRGASTPNADQKSGEGFGLPVTTGGWPSKVDSVLCGQAGGPDI